MRLAELCRTTGVTAPTVKWYLRTGLLHRGDATAVNQASYDESHVRRLRLIRALIEVGGLSTEAVAAVLGALDDEDRTVQDVLAVAHDASAPQPSPPGQPAMERVEAFLRHRGWRVRAGSAARRQLGAALCALASLRDSTAPDIGSAEAVAALLDPYADAVENLASAEIANAPDDLADELLIERAVAGTVILEQAMAALRRMAQEHFARQRYGDTST